MTERQHRILHRLLLRVTVAWVALYLPPLVIAAAIGDAAAPLRWLTTQPSWLPALVGLHSVAMIAGWSTVLGQRWHRLRAAAREREITRSVEALHAMSPREFETFVARVFQAQGFRVWDVPFRGDHGVDLQLITPDGAPAVAQVKRYTDTVGEPAVRDLYGTMINAGAKRAYLVNTGGFSRHARRWARGKPIELIDGSALLEMLREPGHTFER